MFTGKRIKHCNNRDVSFFVITEIKLNNRLKLKGRWYNDHYNFLYDPPDRITIMKKDLENWKIIPLDAALNKKDVIV